MLQESSCRWHMHAASVCSALVYTLFQAKAPITASETMHDEATADAAYVQEKRSYSLVLLSCAAPDFSASLPGLQACKALHAYKANFTLSSCASSENLANLLLAIVRYAAALPVACPACLATRGRSLGPAAVSDFAEVWCSKQCHRGEAGSQRYLRQLSPSRRLTVTQRSSLQASLALLLKLRASKAVQACVLITASNFWLWAV